VLHRIPEKPDAKKLFNSATLVSSRRKRSATNKGVGFKMRKQHENEQFSKNGNHRD
jgi:hypothetical protein